MRNYINVTKYGNNIYHKYVEHGERRSEFVPFQPSLFFRADSDEEGTHRSLVHGYPLKRKVYDSLNEHYQAERRYKDIGGVIYGDLAPNYQFIAENYDEAKTFDISQLRLIYLDIETEFEPGVFPDPETVQFEVLTISMYDSRLDQYYVLGVGDAKSQDFSEIQYTVSDKGENKNEYVAGNVHFERLKNERALLKRFIDLWCSDDYPDMVVGWNSEKFDIPYLVQRIGKVLGGAAAKKLSPFGKVSSRMKKEEIKPGWYDEYLAVTIDGVNCIDYMKFYKKNVLVPRRSYSLDEIAWAEIGANKLKYNYKYSNLMELHNNDYVTFCRYNIIDVDLMIKINRRRRVLELIAGQAYMAGVNFEDTFSPIKRWDAKLYRRLLLENVVVEPKIVHDKRPEGHGVSEPRLKAFIDSRDDKLLDVMETFVTSIEDEKYRNKPSTGGFVMVPKPGLSKNVVSFDLNSLYPFIIILMNMGVETLYIPGIYEPAPIRKFIKERYGGDEDRFLKERCTQAPNNVYFWRDHNSIFTRVLIEHYELRASIRKTVRDKEELQKRVRDELRRRG
jgi:DNA polymerase elongation subunit (family B)